MEVQRSNVACITATVDSPKLLNELFELFHTNEDYVVWTVNAIFSLFWRTEPFQSIIYNIVKMK